MALVSHPLMWPYSASAATGSAIQAFTATRKTGVALKSKVGILIKNVYIFLNTNFFTLQLKYP